MKSNILGRKTAELLSFLISTGIIVGLLVYLGFEHLQSTNSDSLELKATVLTSDVSKVGNNFIVPIKVENLSDRTPSKAFFTISSGEVNEEKEFEIEYLSRHSSKIIFWSMTKDPRNVPLEIQLKSYQF